jgi:hypothetical protein
MNGGMGLREYRDQETQAWFVTTGYLVRLLINHPRNSMASPFNYRRGSGGRYGHFVSAAGVF